jgi:hypothetical protein
MSTATVNLAKIHKMGQDLIRFALVLDWTARNTVGGGVTITSPLNNRVTILFPANGQLRDSHRRTMMAKIKRYSDPVKYAARRLEFDDIATAADHGVSPRVSMDGPEQSVFAETDTVPTSIAPERTIVSERPWVARFNSTGDKSRGYESETTVERHWSDGTLDYHCAWPGCDYTSPLPRPVANHYARTASHAKVNRSPDKFSIPIYEPSSRQQQRIDRLLREMERAKDELPSEFDLAALAKKMIEMRERHREVHEDYDSGEPMTAEQVLNRIRLMVDQGEYAKRMEAEAEVRRRNDELAAEVANLAERLDRSERNATEAVQAAADLAAQRDEAKAAASRYRDNWKALQEMLQEVGDGNE